MVSTDLKKSHLFADILDQGIDLKVQVTGRSMTPTLRDGDEVVIRNTQQTKLRMGDMILFCAQGRLILHRILLKQYAHSGTILFRTKGDAARSLDEPVKPDQILGRVAEIHKYGRSTGVPTRNIMGTTVWQIRNRLAAAYHLVLLSIKYMPSRVKRTALRCPSSK